MLFKLHTSDVQGHWKPSEDLRGSEFDPDEGRAGVLGDDGLDVLWAPWMVDVQKSDACEEDVRALGEESKE